MKYNKIRKMDIADGPGVRVSIFMQGCAFNCKNCFNPETHDFNGGKEFTDETINRVMELCNNDHIEGLSILGGEPMHPKNIEGTTKLAKTFKEKTKSEFIATASKDSIASNADSTYVSKPKFERKTQFHTIKSGESLGKIADKYNVSITELKKWNSIKGNTIQAGKKLKIYSDKKVIVKTESKSNNDGTYTVKSGDSLFSISKQFPGVSIEDIKKWNDISGDNIQPGMKLKING